MNAIVCMTTDRSIGRNNELIYKISDDLRRFKKFTEGSFVVMGRSTFESLPNGPLKNRINIVFSSSIPGGMYSWDSGKLVKSPEGTVFVVNQVSELFSFVGSHDNVWCLGGGKLYALLLPFISRIEITEVQKPGWPSDVKFPELNQNIWDIVPVSEVLEDEASGVKYVYKTARRK